MRLVRVEHVHSFLNFSGAFWCRDVDSAICNVVRKHRTNVRVYCRLRPCATTFVFWTYTSWCIQDCSCTCIILGRGRALSYVLIDFEMHHRIRDMFSSYEPNRNACYYDIPSQTFYRNVRRDKGAFLGCVLMSRATTYLRLFSHTNDNNAVCGSTIPSSMWM